MSDYYPRTNRYNGGIRRPRPATRAPRRNWKADPMTPEQAAKIVKELNRRVLSTDPDRQAVLIAALLAAVEAGVQRDGTPATKGSASELIDWLMAKEFVPFGSAPASAPAAVQNERRDEPCREPGFYRYDGSVYKVSESRRNPGRFAARRVSGSGWEYAKGIVYRLTPEMRMTPEQIAEFGIQSGVCANCSRRLDDPVSKFIGLGTKCGPEILGRPAYNAAKRSAKADPKVAEQIAAIEAGKATAEAAAPAPDQPEYRDYEDEKSWAEWKDDYARREAAQERKAEILKWAMKG
jgi:hypothetical protein